MRDTFNRCFDQALAWPCTEFPTLFRDVPALDRYEIDELITVMVLLPGMEAEDINRTITGKLLTVKGEQRAKEEVKTDKYDRREVRCGAFERVVELPEIANTEHPSAEFEAGVLTVAFPTVAQEAVKPRCRRSRSWRRSRLTPDRSCPGAGTCRPAAGRSSGGCCGQDAARSTASMGTAAVNNARSRSWQGNSGSFSMIRTAGSDEQKNDIVASRLPTAVVSHGIRLMIARRSRPRRHNSTRTRAPEPTGGGRGCRC
jgi:HSP20 family molecular chaperone IbpA